MRLLQERMKCAFWDTTPVDIFTKSVGLYMWCKSVCKKNWKVSFKIVSPGHEFAWCLYEN